MKRIYLDYAATTPVRPEVIEAALPYFKEDWGNPSSIHSHGLDARAGVDAARAQVAKLINSLPEEIYFTGGGTEADNWALKGIPLINRGRGNHIITSSIEHHAISWRNRGLRSRICRWTVTGWLIRMPCAKH
jgi:cysteine desulfurase